MMDKQVGADEILEFIKDRIGIVRIGRLDQGESVQGSVRPICRATLL